jgi:hypothetical protein
MHIIAASFDAEAAITRTREVLALGDSPERLAEKLGITRELEMIKEGVVSASFKRLAADIKKLTQYKEVEKQLDEIKADKSVLRFLGAKFKEKQIAKLEEDLLKFGALIEAPRWFYRQPRVQLLSAIRDYALDGSQQGDAAWIEVDEDKLDFPIVNMYEKADQAFALNVTAQLEKPLKDVDPKFVLEKFEGNRSISFDFEKGVATYYTPAPSS